MKPAKVWAMPWVMRVIGYFATMPAALCLGYGVLITSLALRGKLDLEIPYGSAIALAYGAFLAFLGAVIGIFAWRFGMRRAVYKCIHCGSVMNRASQPYARA